MKAKPRIYLSSLLLLFLVTIAYVFFSYYGLSKPLDAKVTEWENGWVYLWESEYQSMKDPVNRDNAIGWKPYTIGMDLEGSREGKTIYIQNIIPEDLPPNYSLLVHGIDLSFRVYVDGELRYSEGAIPIARTIDFPGLVRHNLFHLKDSDKGKTITFLCYSNWIHIGFSDFALLGPADELLFYILRHYEFFILFSSVLALLSGFVGISFGYLIQSRTILYLGGFLLSLSIFLLYESHLFLGVWNHPLLSTVIGEPSIVFSVYMFICFFESMPFPNFKKVFSFEKKYLLYFCLFSFFYTAFVSMDLKFQYWISIPTYSLMTFNILLMCLVTMLNQKQASIPARLLLFSFIFIFSGIFPQALWELRLLPQMPSFYFHFSFLGFVSCLVLIIFFHIKEFYLRLRDAKEILEKELHAKKQELEKEQEAKINLARQIAIQSERTAIFSDLHDEIGQKALDLNILSQTQSKTQEEWEKNFQKIRVLSESLLLSVRYRFHHREDLELLSQDFQLGIHLFLLHRYELHQRRIIVEFSNDAEFKGYSIEFQDNLFQLIRELTNNDLKYGPSGVTANLEFQNKPNYLSIDFRSQTNFHSRSSSRKDSDRSIFLRVTRMKGTIEESLDDTSYGLKIQIPFG